MMALLSAVLMGCNEDFDSLIGPQSNLPESLVPADAVSVSTQNAPVTVRLESYINEENNTETPLMIGVASVKEGAMPVKTEWVFVGRAALRGKRCEDVMAEMRRIAEKSGKGQ